MNFVLANELGAGQSVTSALATGRLIVPGMASDHCAGIISGSIKRLPGIAVSGRAGPQGR